jgi:hypothetical protein
MVPMYFSVVFSDLFSQQIRPLTTIERLDEVLDGAYWALCRKPDSFPVVVEGKDIRLIKTLPMSWAGGEIPALLIWYSIDFDECQVHLLAVKTKDAYN